MAPQVILITGASSGLGLAAARHLAALGHRVYGTSRNPSPEGLPFTLIRMDVTDPLSVETAVRQVISAEGRIDVLLNNAGLGISGAIESFTDEEISIQMDTNFNGVARVTRAVLPSMRERKAGRIINVSSVGGLIGLPYQGFYSAAKFAIEGYSEALAMEVRPWNIRVVVVNPGDFRTGFTGARRMASRDREGSAYTNRAVDATEKMGRDEQGGCDPKVFAGMVARIVRARRPHYRYIPGRFDQRLIARIRHLLPPALVRWIIAGHYGI